MKTEAFSNNWMTGTGLHELVLLFLVVVVFGCLSVLSYPINQCRVISAP